MMPLCSFLAGGDFWRVLITLQTVWTYIRLDILSGLICIKTVGALMVVLKENFGKDDFEKKTADNKRAMQRVNIDLKPITLHKKEKLFEMSQDVSRSYLIVFTYSVFAKTKVICLVVCC